MRLALALAFLLATATVYADNARVRPVQAVPVVTTVQAVPVATLVPVTVQVPTFSVSYDQGKDNDPIHEELKAIRQLLERMGGGPLLRDLSGADLLKQSCVSCHGANVATTKGGTFKMFDAAGAAMPLSLPERRRAAELIQTGVMPKGGPLSEAVKARLVGHLKGGP